jgi:hypothetical protein
MAAGFDPGLRLPTLWTDRTDAMDGQRGLHATGKIDDAEAGDLAHFNDHGWLVWSKAIQEPLIDRFVADIHSVYTTPGHYVTTDFAHNRGERLNGREADRAESM